MGARSWYLDPLVARQKADAFTALVERWHQPRSNGLVLKTDLFEEANGQDALVPQLRGRGGVIGIDLDPGTVRGAARRFPTPRLHALAADLRRLGVRDGAFDLVVSPSTVDHFGSRAEIEACLREMHRVLRPLGTAVVILDNPRNPLYHPLRWVSPLIAPCRLGRTLGRGALVRELERLGFEVLGHEYVIHNPRGVSTLVNLLLRRAAGRRAERAIRALLALWSVLDRLPTRSWSACFVAVAAVKRQGSTPPASSSV